MALIWIIAVSLFAAQMIMSRKNLWKMKTNNVEKNVGNPNVTNLEVRLL